MAMGVGEKYMTARLGILNLTIVKSNVGHYVLKVVGNKILPIVLQMAHESINKNT